MPIPCPFCNATVRVPADRRAIRPRCGETVPVPADAIGDGDAPLPAATIPSAKPSNRALGLGVLGVMLAMAGITLAYALATIEFRRKNDHKSDDAKAAAVVAVPPGELAGLAYLPADVEAVAGIAVGRAMETELGRRLLKMVPLVGLSPDDIDHIVAGASIQLSPKVTLVVRTRARIDVAKVRTAIKAERGETYKGRTLFAAKLPVGGYDCFVTFPDERTLLAVLVKETLDAQPAQPAGGVERFPGATRVPIAQLPTDSLAWLVAHKEPENAAVTLGLTLLGRQVPAEVAEGLRALRSLSAHATERAGGLEVGATARGFEAKQATAIRDALKQVPSGQTTATGDDPLTVRWALTADEVGKLLKPAP